MPQILYLFTSSSTFDLEVKAQDTDERRRNAKDLFVPYWTDDPMGKPRAREMRSTIWNFTGNSGW